MPYGITQCYLPPGRSEIPAFTPAEAGTRFNDPEGCKAELSCFEKADRPSIKPSTCQSQVQRTAEPPRKQQIRWLDLGR